MGRKRDQLLGEDFLKVIRPGIRWRDLMGQGGAFVHIPQLMARDRCLIARGREFAFGSETYATVTLHPVAA
ncbi:MAG: hypothetical protein HY854_10105 [Burkholderiales bacterium]|nr:hypothetical protein [Burkholderiales bacterium]